MSHHTWRHRFETALRNKNWKKILLHQIFEYSIIGTTVMALEAKPESWIIGIAIAFVVHLIMFEAIDAFHPKKKDHNKLVK